MLRVWRYLWSTHSTEKLWTGFHSILILLTAHVSSWKQFCSPPRNLFLIQNHESRFLYSSETVLLKTEPHAAESKHWFRPFHHVGLTLLQVDVRRGLVWVLNSSWVWLCFCTSCLLALFYPLSTWNRHTGSKEKRTGYRASDGLWVTVREHRQSKLSCQRWLMGEVSF